MLTTAKEAEDEIFSALASGVDGYCLKSMTGKELEQGLRSLKQGDFWLGIKIGKNSSGCHCRTPGSNLTQQRAGA